MDSDTATLIPESGFHFLNLVPHGWQWNDKGLESWYFTPGNERCFECSTPLTPSDAWVSVTCAVSLCPKCAGLHRALGSHLSVVKSLSLDSWIARDIERLTRGGNSSCSSALGISASNIAPCIGALRVRHQSAEFKAYQLRLDGNGSTGDIPRREVQLAIPDAGNAAPASWLSYLNAKCRFGWVGSFRNSKSIFESAEAGSVAEV